MGYSTVEECDLILAQALTSSTPTAPTTSLVKLIDIGNSRDTNRVPDTTVEYYINLADSQIDGILSQQYFTPFDKCAHGEWILDEDLNAVAEAGTEAAGTDALTDTSGTPDTTTSNVIEVSTAVNLIPGDEIVLHDDLTGDEEILIVATIVDQNTFTTTTDVEGIFLVDSGIRIIRLRFPPPLNQISARYATSFIYDKYFAAQAQPSISDYGKEMRIIAMGQLNDILSGKILVKCARRRGGMFDNPWLDSAYGAAAPWNGFDTTSRDMSKPQ
ncbi:hypothetical protein LCGC14_2704870, partial [marine sediment metagenome]